LLLLLLLLKAAAAVFHPELKEKKGNHETRDLFFGVDGCSCPCQRWLWLLSSTKAAVQVIHPVKKQYNKGESQNKGALLNI